MDRSIDTPSYGAQAPQQTAYGRPPSPITWDDARAGGWDDGDWDHQDHSRLQSRDVVRVMLDDYEKPTKLQSGFTRPLKDVVSEVHRKVCCITQGKGAAIGTAVFLDHCHILTARHCVTNVDLRTLSVRVEYEMRPYGLNYGNSVAVRGCIEHCEDLDYAILRLARDVPSAQVVSTISLRRLVDGPTVLISHPGGAPKKVMVHESVTSEYELLQYIGFHDSRPGSSGGGYFDANGTLVALNLQRFGSTGETGGVWMKIIQDSSPALEHLFDSSSGKRRKRLGQDQDLGRQAPIISFRLLGQDSGDSTLELPFFELLGFKLKIPFFVHPLTGKLSEAKRYLGFKSLPSLNGHPQARHHIIPTNDMHYLWTLGRDCPKLGYWVERLAWQASAGSHKMSTLDACEWCPFNLFLGYLPTARAQTGPGCDPPPNHKEQMCPLSFDTKSWAAITELYNALQDCYNARQTLGAVLGMHGAVRVVAGQSLNDFKEAIWKPLSEPHTKKGSYSRKTQYNPVNAALPSTSPHSATSKEVDSYVQALNRVLAALIAVSGARSASGKMNHIHQTSTGDWYKAPGSSKWRLKSEPSLLQRVWKFLFGPYR